VCRQLGLTTGVLGVPSLLRVQGGRFEDGTVIRRGEGLGNDRHLQRSGGKAFLVAAGGAVPLAREAGVVAVDAAVAIQALEASSPDGSLDPSIGAVRRR
jgi:hypothetical protein